MNENSVRRDEKQQETQPGSVRISRSPDPFFNLAAEDHFFSSGLYEFPMLILWKNRPCVVIGRCQNPWKECNLQVMASREVTLARRKSGGGTVYHDPGNINFTLITKRADFDKVKNGQIIIQALQDFGIPAELNSRNDITVHNRKISGSAYRIVSAGAYHHGTLLVSADLPRLKGCLTPDDSTYRTRGIASVRSPVINLSEISPGITMELIMQAVIYRFSETWLLNPDPEYFDETLEQRYPEITILRKELESWQWIFGRTPEFSRDFFTPGIPPAEGLKLTVECRNGIITALEGPGAKTKAFLIGREYSEEEIAEAMRGSA